MGSWRGHLCLVGSCWGLVQVMANISPRTGFNHPNQAPDGPRQGGGDPKTPCALIKWVAEGGTQRGAVLFPHLRATRRKSSCYKPKFAAHFNPAAFRGCLKSYHNWDKKWKCFGDEGDFDASRGCWNVLLLLRALCCLTSPARY